MADITITCGACGNRITVSEYVDAEELVCVKCRQKVPIPRRLPDEPVASQLKLASAGGATPAAPPPAAAPVVSLSEEVRRNTPAMKRLRRRRTAGGWSQALWAGIVFTLLSGGLLYLRFYPGAMPGGQRELLITAAITALGILHVSVIAYAFADEAFHGIMCTIIPGYSAYYLFVHADQFLLRAVVAALLLTFGLDTMQALKSGWNRFYVAVSSWIQDTDTYKKDRVPNFK